MLLVSQDTDPKALGSNSPLIEKVPLSPAYWPFAEVVTSVFRFLHIPLREVLQYDYNDVFPYWLHPPPKVCLTMSSLSKSADHPALMKTSFLSHLPLHACSVPVYTDGSRRGCFRGLSRPYGVPHSPLLLICVYGRVDCSAFGC